MSLAPDIFVIRAARDHVLRFAEAADPADLDGWGIDETLDAVDGIALGDYTARFIPDFDRSGWRDPDTFLLVGTVQIQVIEAEINGHLPGGGVRLSGGTLHYPFSAEIEKVSYPDTPTFPG